MGKSLVSSFLLTHGVYAGSLHASMRRRLRRFYCFKPLQCIRRTRRLVAIIEPFVSALYILQWRRSHAGATGAQAPQIVARPQI